MILYALAFMLEEHWVVMLFAGDQIKRVEIDVKIALKRLEEELYTCGKCSHITVTFQRMLGS